MCFLVTQKAPDGFEPPLKAMLAFPFPAWVRRHFKSTYKPSLGKSGFHEWPFSNEERTIDSGRSEGRRMAKSTTYPASATIH